MIRFLTMKFLQYIGNSTEEENYQRNIILIITKKRQLKMIERIGKK